jgi:hypothetical protein
MQTLLIVAIVLITLAVLAQAGVLVAMYLMSRRMAAKAEGLMDESRRMMAPLEAAASNLKTVADDLNETGKLAREQVLHVQSILFDTQQRIRVKVEDVGDSVVDTVNEAGGLLIRPIRHYSALAIGIAEGISAFLFGRGRREHREPGFEEEHPAA